jgi:tetratricopeptide (TPR) repeat protein
MTSTPHIVRDDRGAGEACLDSELLASYIDGRVTSTERARVEAHLAGCDDCYFVFSETFQESGGEAGLAPGTVLRPRRWTTQVGWRAAAASLAAAAAVVVAVQVFRSDTGRSETLVAALTELERASGPNRRFAPRLSEVGTYKPQAAVLRSGSPNDEVPLSLREAALKVETAAKSGNLGAQERRALAVMYLTLGDAQNAAEIVSPIAETTTDAALLNDIGAALLARGGEGDATRALELLERVVGREPNRPEAWFNLGLAAEAAGAPTRARDAWTRYLAIDPSSEWAGEAREHLDKLPQRDPVR